MKQEIVNKIKPAQKVIPLPDLSIFNSKNDIPNTALLKKSVEEAASTFHEVDNVSKIPQLIQQLYPESKTICDATGSLEIGNIDPLIIDKAILDNLDICIVKAQIIVEENGAVWIKEEDIKNRLLLCICEHIIVIVDKKTIVSNMHGAYQKIANNSNYGVFVCGPSKTADIAQTLVIGAHGPKSMSVILFDKNP